MERLRPYEILEKSLMLGYNEINPLSGGGSPAGASV